MSHEPKSTDPPVTDATDGLHLDLPSGRQVALHIDSGREEIVLVGQDGFVELQVTLTDEGPVLKMPAGRVQLRGADLLDLSARRVRLRADEDLTLEAGAVHLRADANVEVDADDDVRVRGRKIYLN